MVLMNQIIKPLSYIKVITSSLFADVIQSGYIPISQTHPQKENGLILKGWGVELRVLGWIFWF